MIRFTWLQSRLQLLVASAGVAAVAVVLAINGPRLVHLFDAMVAGCRTGQDCSADTTQFLSSYRPLRIGLDALVAIVPGLIGVFWGAPLVARELETGTWRLAWTQSVSRTRWLAVKIAVFALAGMAIAGLLSLMATWWSSPLDTAGMTLWTSFEWRDVVPVGYAAFALALGVAAGLVIGRTVPAMAATLVLFVGVRLGFDRFVRPHLVGPARLTLRLDPSSPAFAGFSPGSVTILPKVVSVPNGWMYSTGIADGGGHPLTAAYVSRACPFLGQNMGIRQMRECIEKVGQTYREVVWYQPASHYWALQWYELALYLGAAVALAGLSLWWVRHRVT
jgi:hypothetical protein